MNLVKSINLNIAQKLEQREYRDAFFEEWAKDEISDQIRHLRKTRKLRQVDIAKETGMKQSAVSRIEQSQYSNWNFATLLRIARALDARVRVVFEPAEDVIKEYSPPQRKPSRGSSALDVRENILFDDQRKTFIGPQNSLSSLSTKDSLEDQKLPFTQRIGTAKNQGLAL